jgi:Fe-S oxidoreductase
VREIGAETLVAACPWCKSHFSEVAGENGDALQVLDIAEVICASLDASAQGGKS